MVSDGDDAHSVVVAAPTKCILLPLILSGTRGWFSPKCLKGSQKPGHFEHGLPSRPREMPAVACNTAIQRIEPLFMKVPIHWLIPIATDLTFDMLTSHRRTTCSVPVWYTWLLLVRQSYSMVLIVEKRGLLIRRPRL